MGTRTVGQKLAKLGKTPALWVAVIAMVLSFVIAKSISKSYFNNVVDDSLISMQYAKNVAHGNGVVFNVGERVEGYTNFLWVIVMAAIYRACELIHTPFLPVIINTSILLSVVDMALVYLIGRKLWKDRLLPMLVTAGLLLVDNGYQMWAAMALESHLLALCFLTSVAILLYRPRRWPLMLGLALTCVQMTRPDGALFSVMLIGSELLELLLDARKTTAETERRAAVAARARELGLASAVWLGTFGVYFAWRYSYYGFLHPNTYYFKVGVAKMDAWARGIAYVRAFVEERAYWPIFAIFAARWFRTPILRALVVYLIGHVVYQMYVGGDFYAGHRFFIGQIPLFAILIGQVFYGVQERIGVWIQAAFALKAPPPQALLTIVLTMAAGIVMYEERQIGTYRGPLVEEVKRWGAERNTNRDFLYWLHDHKPAGASLATGDIGSAGFFGDFIRVIDLYGVIDTVIAHRDVKNFGKGQAGHEKRANVEETLAKKPTFIKIGYLHDDFYRHGYFINAEVPHTIDVRGLWQRDDLLETGTFDEAGGIHFEGALPADWKVEGDAFEAPTSASARKGQGTILGPRGSFINTFSPKRDDKATGSLTTTPFELKGEKVVVRVGGGYDPENLRVSLVVDGQRVFSATGRNNDTMGRKTWDIAALRGKMATIEIVDHSTKKWGHITVDEIVQWSPKQAP